MSQVPNIIESLLSEIDRVEEIAKEYENINSAMNTLASSLMIELKASKFKMKIKEAKLKISTCDTSGMVRIYEELKELKL